MTEIVEVTEQALQLDREEILQRFGEWMRLDVADGNASQETLRAYAGDVRQHLVWVAQRDQSPGAISHDDLKAYRSWLLGHYAISTVGRKLVAVRRFYEMAQARGHISVNPGARLRSPSDHTDRAERIKYLAFEDYCSVLAMPVRLYGDTDPVRCDRDLAILACMGIHGLRVIEVHRLSLRDVNLGDGEYGVVCVFGKGNKWRTIYLTDETRLVVIAWLQSREALAMDEQAVFLTLHHGVRHGEAAHHRISRRSVRALVDGYLSKADVKRPGISCHAMRHSFATHSLAKGARLIDISKALGHASVTTTQVYAQVLDRDRNNPSRLLHGIVQARSAQHS